MPHGQCTLPPDDAYALVIEEDALQAYQWFVELFPQYPYAAAIWDIINARREELLWRRALASNSPNVYWNYLNRYPNGVHAVEAQQQLETAGVWIIARQHAPVDKEGNVRWAHGLVP